jgi:hypothetical protein
MGFSLDAFGGAGFEFELKLPLGTDCWLNGKVLEIVTLDRIINRPYSS